MTLNPKQAVKEWISEVWNNKVKQPIANKTQQLENSATQQVNSALNNYSPSNYYWKQEPFYRGLFWMAVGLLIILWIISS